MFILYYLLLGVKWFTLHILLNQMAALVLSKFAFVFFCRSDFACWALMNLMCSISLHWRNIYVVDQQMYTSEMYSYIISVFYRCAFVGFLREFKYSLEQFSQPLICHLICDTQQILIIIVFSTSRLERLLSKRFIIFWTAVPCSYITVAHSCVHFWYKDVTC